MADAPAPAPPAPAPTPAPAAPPREAVIDQNPVNQPAPIGQQAPPLRQGEPHKPAGRPESRREAIARAFEDTREGVKFPVAKARVGHNQPPEPVAAEKPTKSEPPIDLRKRPAERDEGGRFTPREPVGGVQSGRREAPPGQLHLPGQGPQARPGAAPQLPANAPYRDPPQRMSAAAKAAWAATPDHVRADVHRMQNEFGQYYQRSRADVAEMHSIRMFRDLARSHGTSLQKALTNYVSMETKLRNDPLGGLDTLVHNMNLRTADGYQLTFRDIAQYVASQSPEQHARVRTANVQGAHDARIGQLTTQVQQLTQALTQMHSQQQYSQRYGQTRQGVDRFAETHPRLDELSDVIVAELRAGHTLENAYARANLLRPQTAAQTRGNGNGNGTSAAQPRGPVDRSISGAPAGAAPNGRAARRTAGKSTNRRDIIANAVRKASGSL